MTDAISAALLSIGALFLLLAAVGITRMPDLLIRMQTATKASTLGVGCMLLAAAVYFSDFGSTMRALLGTFFFFMTAPVAAHMIGRAAYVIGVPLWEGTIVDELDSCYDPQTHTLHSAPVISGDVAPAAPGGTDAASLQSPPQLGPRCGPP